MIRQFLRRWTSGRRGRAQDAGDAFLLYVRCDHCGEIVRVRIDPRWDLAQEFDDDVTGYSLQKDIVGSACNRVITVRMAFDRGYNVITREIEGGRFADREEFDTSQTRPAQPHPPGRQA